MSNVVWRPQPRQEEFMRRPEYEALYGGAAGGGKSEALVIEALRQVNIPHYKGLILRKSYPQLSELIDKSILYYPRAYPGAKYNASTHTWTFPSGARIIFGSMNRKEDKIKYQGKRFDYIAFDELTHFTWEEYSYMFSRNRSSGPGVRSYIRATANPGGVGHGWVKDRFIIPAPPMTTIADTVKYSTPSGETEEASRTRVFVPATVYDNQILLKNDPEYVATLALLPPAERQALLYGDWDSFSGQVFSEWRNDPAGYLTRKFSHVIEPFEFPSWWRVVRGFDYGYSKPFSVGWYAVSPDDVIYRVAELYGGDADVGVKWTPDRIAEEIAEIEKTHPLLRDVKVVLGLADPAIFSATVYGESIAELLARKGVYFSKGDNTRLAGKMQLHNRLAFDEEGRAKFYVFNTCRNFIRTIPSLVYSTVNVEDVDTTQEDHAYDECRYVLMAHPMTTVPRVKRRWRVPELDIDEEY
ncbi:MAG: terminase family protein [Clostridia bacterium]|nr:terminase family protein [Clostridia bacterium]